MVFLAMLCSTWGTVQAQQAGSRYFPETGHYVTGEFLAYYQNVSEASLVFGLPITEAFITNTPIGRLVQYFQRARFEFFPDQPEGQRIRLTALGLLLYKAGPESMNLNTPGVCRTFSTGFSVCYDFLTFFDAHGGLNRFGHPVSPFEFQEDGCITQTFEGARLEWHPELQRGENIRLADLGSIYFYQVGEDPARLQKPLPLSGAMQLPSQTIISLKAMVFVLKAVTRTNDIQKVFVVVQDQTLTPVGGASGTVTVNLPGQPALVYPVTTDAKGVAVVPEISFMDIPSGTLVQIRVSMVYGALSSSATTSFRVWR